MDLDRLHSSALYTSTHASLRPSKGPPNSPIKDIVLCFKCHARQITQHHFDPAELIDASAWTAHILHADTDSLDRGCKFSQLPAQLLQDYASVVLAKIPLPKHTDMRWNDWCFRTT
jgi:hypothetical protein